jgi:plasmid stability protein
MKMISLDFMGNIIERGNRGEELYIALESLGLEGIRNQTRENGRLINNFPDVRLRAATQLGQLGTAEARDILITMLLAENEPMVIAEIIRSLGIIGINDNDETAAAISFIVSRIDIVNPNNILAFSTLDAFERLAAASGGMVSAATITMIFRIAEGNYIRPVRDRARALLHDLMMLNVVRN